MKNLKNSLLLCATISTCLTLQAQNRDNDPITQLLDQFNQQINQLVASHRSQNKPTNQPTQKTHSSFFNDPFFSNMFGSNTSGSNTSGSNAFGSNQASNNNDDYEVQIFIKPSNQQGQQTRLKQNQQPLRPQISPQQQQTQ
ncbi:hypothetical protein KAT92_04040, partial [Candidatus Babeliales bacterium]|nr:hypothetical protein [Candidatus Babeliales bacterium]